MKSNRTSRRARFNFRAWNVLLFPFVPALGFYTLWRRFGQKKSAESLRGQWGKIPAEVRAVLRKSSTRSELQNAPRIWIHAVSVGETLAARPVARALKTAIPNCVLLLSTTTDSGQEAAQAAKKAGEINAVFYFPLDLSFPIRRALKAVQPQVFITLETELWPNFLHLVRQSGAQTFLVNGRVSENLLKRAPQMGALWRWMTGNLDGFLMRSETDADRIRALGASSSRVFTMGDVKLDALNTIENIGAVRAHWRRTLEVGDAPFLVAGSTHDGEDEAILTAFAQVKTEFSDARLLLAPRHMERVESVAQQIRNSNFAVQMRSEIGAQNFDENAVLLLDTIGELSQIYAAADASFVGGSLVRRGGHNVLEPVLCGVAVAFGPHIANFRDAGALVESADVGRKVNDADQLAQVWLRWLRDDAWRTGVARRAEDVLLEHRGASMRVAEHIARALHDFEYSM